MTHKLRVRGKRFAAPSMVGLAALLALALGGCVPSKGAEVPGSAGSGPPSLGEARAGHDAFGLADGTVVVAGGIHWPVAADGGHAPARRGVQAVEAWKPGAGEGWRRVGVVPTARLGGMAATDGRSSVWLLGGRDAYGTSSPAVVRVDVARGEVTHGPDLRAGRARGTVTRLADGGLLVAGGLGPGGVVAEAELLAPDGGAWQRVAALPEPRTLHTATLLPGGDVLVVGGLDERGAASAATFRYDAAADVWRRAADLPAPRTDHVALPVPGGVVVVGGTAGEERAPAAGVLCYAAEDDRWSRCGTLAVPRTGHAAVALGSGAVLVCGGRDAAGDLLASSEISVPAGGPWRSGPRLAAARAAHTATALPDGRVLVIGGVAATGGGERPTASAELLAP